MPKDDHPLQISIRGDAAIAEFFATKLLDGPCMKAACNQLLNLANESAFATIKLNLTGIEYLSSSSLGTLIGLHKRLLQLGIRFCIFNAIPQIFEVFEITKLNRFFEIRERDDEDVDSENAEDDDDFEDGQAGVNSRRIPPKPSDDDAVILPFPPTEST